MSGNQVAVIVIAVLCGLGLLAFIATFIYAAGWNASVRHHKGRDPMDPFWTTYV
jgi:hypothetical protein